MNIGLVILAVYIAVLLGIALYASKKDKKKTSRTLPQAVGLAFSF